VVRLPGRKKVGDIFVGFDTISACDGQTDRHATTAAKTALRHSVVRVKWKRERDLPMVTISVLHSVVK